MSQILDCSAGHLGGAAVAARGYAGAARYLPKEGGSIVVPLSVAELVDLRAHGRTVVFIAEHRDPARPLTGGYGGGVHDAQWFWAQAVAIVTATGLPDSVIRAVYFTCDTDTTSTTRPAAAAYYRGVQDTMGRARTGVYGEYDLIDYLVGLGIGAWYWQTYAWSIGHNHDDQARHPAAHLFQRLGEVAVGGVGCDVNDVLKVDYGQINEEDDMTPEEHDMLKFVKDRVAGFLVQRYLVSNPDGTVTVVPEGTPGAEPAHALDTADGNYLVNMLAPLSDDEQKMLAALRAQPTGGQVDVPALAAALAPLLPQDATPNQIAEAVRVAFAAHLGGA